MGCSIKDKKGQAITKAYQKIVKESNHKPKKTWMDKGSEFYSRSMKSWFESNNIEISSKHNEAKLIVVE